VEVLEDLKEKAEGELSDSRKAEASARDNHAMLKQSLEDKLKADSKDMDDEKAGVSEAKEGRAVAEGDLAVTMKDLKNSKASLATANSDCMRTAADHEATVAARTEELKVVAKTKKILQDSTGGAETQTYSLLQVTSSSKTRAALANSQVLEMVKTLAQKQHSAALSQLASRISAVVRYSGSAEANPFEKVKGLITDMLSKLQREADSEATEKAYCDEQMSKTEAKKAELEDDIEQLTSKIDKAAARSAELKEEVAELQSELGALQKAQAEMDAVRQASHANYAKAKTELTAGLEGVRKALGVLREYYGGGAAAAAMLQDDEKFGEFMQQPAPPQQHEKSAGAGGGIISMLEICESDFAINLAKEETEEADAADAYDRMTQENKVSKTGKEQDVSYKTKEAISLDKGISDISGDRNSAQTEQSAVLEYYAKIKERCVAKPDSYESLKSRREAEVQGLREALSVLENEASFLQRRHRRGVRFMQVQ
jgi:predicted transcriptional regulator